MWHSMQIGDSLFDFMSVYALIELRLTATFWCQIVDVVPIVDSGGDFNNVESFSNVRALTLPHLTSVATVE